MTQSIYNGEPIKMLSWKQPYGGLMFTGKIETRSWMTSYRGWVLLCMSKEAYKHKQLQSISANDYHRIVRIMDAMPLCHVTGMATGIGKLVDCQSMKEEDAAKAYVDYYADLYCHFYEEVKQIEPFPVLGKLGYADVPQEYIDKIKLL